MKEKKVLSFSGPNFPVFGLNTESYSAIHERNSCFVVAWFRSYLTNRKQYISITHDNKINQQKGICGVPQGSVLGSLLFLIYIKDLPNASNLLNTIMFEDDTNLFFENKNKSVLFSTVKSELKREYCEWFISKKLSLNITKTKFPFVHKASRRDDLPFVLPKLFINNQVIKKQSFIKFLGILLDGNPPMERAFEND